jgi:hypothetical protein
MRSRSNGPEPKLATEICGMRTITLSWETWRAVIDALRAKGLPYMREHPDHLERLLDQYPPDAMVTLSLTDNVFLRSYNWARVELGLPLAAD